MRRTPSSSSMLPPALALPPSPSSTSTTCAFALEAPAAMVPAPQPDEVPVVVVVDVAAGVDVAVDRAEAASAGNPRRKLAQRRHRKGSNAATAAARAEDSPTEGEAVEGEAGLGKSAVHTSLSCSCDSATDHTLTVPVDEDAHHPHVPSQSHGSVSPLLCQERPLPEEEQVQTASSRLRAGAVSRPQPKQQATATTTHPKAKAAKPSKQVDHPPQETNPFFTIPAAVTKKSVLPGLAQDVCATAPNEASSARTGKPRAANPCVYVHVTPLVHQEKKPGDRTRQTRTTGHVFADPSPRQSPPDEDVIYTEVAFATTDETDVDDMPEIDAEADRAMERLQQQRFQTIIRRHTSPTKSEPGDQKPDSRLERKRSWTCPAGAPRSQAAARVCDQAAELNTSEMGRPRTSTYPFPSLEISPSNVRLGRMVRDGDFGQVWYEAHWQQGRTGQWVTVKTVNPQNPLAQEVRLHAEADLMMRLHIPHENVQRILGVVADTSPLQYVMECVNDGDLHAHLVSRGEAPLSTKECLSFALQIAEGMAHIESFRLVHGNLRAKNVFMSSQGTLKIGDWGVKCHTTTWPDSLPFQWRSLETLTKGRTSTKSDVWSFGVTLWEIFSSGKTPFQALGSASDLVLHLNHGRRLPVPENCLDSVYKLMQTCWFANDEQRPSFAQQRAIIESLHKSCTSRGLKRNTSRVRLFFEKFGFKQKSPQQAQDAGETMTLTAEAEWERIHLATVSSPTMSRCGSTASNTTRPFGALGKRQPENRAYHKLVLPGQVVEHSLPNEPGSGTDGVCAAQPQLYSQLQNPGGVACAAHPQQLYSQLQSPAGAAACTAQQQQLYSQLKSSGGPQEQKESAQSLYGTFYELWDPSSVSRGRLATGDSRYSSDDEPLYGDSHFFGLEALQQQEGEEEEDHSHAEAVSACAQQQQQQQQQSRQRGAYENVEIVAASNYVNADAVIADFAARGQADQPRCLSKTDSQSMLRQLHEQQQQRQRALSAPSSASCSSLPRRAYENCPLTPEPPRRHAAANAGAAESPYDHVEPRKSLFSRLNLQK